ncbi:MAG TPA: hypothetical protein VMK53_07545 [Gemmatimonadales bacterium]|nr:hypothetical protein [Gemmatimonadales bacterium]
MQGSPPANEGYMVAAYVVTAVIVLAYALSLWLRARALLGREDAGR